MLRSYPRATTFKFVSLPKGSLQTENTKKKIKFLTKSVKKAGKKLKLGHR